VTRILALYPAGIAGWLLISPFVDERTGPLALAQILSMHFAIVGLALIPVALHRRATLLRYALGVLAVISVARFGGELVSLPGLDRHASIGFTVMSWNLELGARSGNAAVAGLLERDVDIVALQELGPDHVQEIEASTELTGRYSHRVLHPDAGVLGMGLLSRWPIDSSVRSIDPPALEAVLDVGRPITVIGAHPLAGRITMAGPLPAAFDAATRDDALRRLRRQIDAAVERHELVVVLGDVNTAPTEPGYHELVAGLRDAHVEVGQGPGFTWRPSRFESLGVGLLRIDVALAGPGLRPVDVAERCHLAGDHCQLEARFEVDAASAAEGEFDLLLPGFADIDPLPVIVSDTTGLVSAVGLLDEPGGIDGVRALPGRPEALVVSWLGGMCDRRARVAVVPVGAEIRIGIETERADACLLAGIGRSIVIQFDHAINLEIVTVEEVPGR